jgi:hypothetical protein
MLLVLLLGSGLRLETSGIAVLDVSPESTYVIRSSVFANYAPLKVNPAQ